MKFNRNSRGGLSPAMHGGGLSVKVDTSALTSLARGLGDLRDEVSDRIIRSSFKDAGTQSKAEASRRVIDRGGFRKANLAGRVRSGMRWYQPAPMSGVIESNNNWFSLARWSNPRTPKGNYTSNPKYGRPASGGLRITGHVSDFNLKDKRHAFVRKLNNGNVHVASGAGSGWHKGKRWSETDKKTNAKIAGVFHSMNPSHILHHHVVHDPVVEHFNVKLQQRFVSKYEGAIDKIKAAHGL